MKDKDVNVGDHYWALSHDELVVVMKDEDGRYQVCGAWEGGLYETPILLEFIPRPKGHENTKLYYVDE